MLAKYFPSSSIPEYLLNVATIFGQKSWEHNVLLKSTHLTYWGNDASNILESVYDNVKEQF